MNKDKLITKTECPDRNSVKRLYGHSVGIHDLGSGWIITIQDKPTLGWHDNTRRATIKK